MIANSCIWVGRKIVKEHVAGCLGFFSGCGLLVGDFVQSNDNGGVATTRVVEEKASNLLHALDSGFVKERGKVRIG